MHVADGGCPNFGDVGNRILAAQSDFDGQIYGCPNPSTVVAKSSGLETRRDVAGAVWIRRKARSGGQEVGAVMTPEEFETDVWVERLARTLAWLHAVQTRYEGENVRYRPHSARYGIHDPPYFGPRHRLGSLGDLYCAAFQSNEDHDVEHYRPLRAALDGVRGALGTHPAWAHIVDRADGTDGAGKIWTQIASNGQLGTLWKVVGGLMARAMEVSDDGFQEASSELGALLAPERERGPTCVAGDLTAGYHVTLFLGLRVDREIKVSDGMKIVPFEDLTEFIDRSDLQGVSPENLRSSRSVGAIVKPFRWKPEFHASGEDREQGEDWKPEARRLGSFFDDADRLIELLAVWHGVPVVRLETIPYCIHRTAFCLLGEEHRIGGYTMLGAVRSLGRFSKVSEMNTEALDEARKSFCERDSDLHREYAPILSRLAEALARSGRFGIDDKILDIAIVLERLYKPRDRGISAQLQKSAARLLASGSEEQTKVEEGIKHFYDVRSAVIHGPKDEKKRRLLEEREVAFRTGFDLARRSVMKLLHDGPPPVRKGS